MTFNFRKPILLAFLSIVFTCISSDAYAQRTARGQYYVDAVGAASITATPSLGGSVQAGQYLLSSRWEAGVDLLVKRDGTFYVPVYANASYLFRLCTNSTRAISLYAGLGALMGAEITQPEAVSSDTGYGDAGGNGLDINFEEVQDAEQAPSNVAFIYGLQPKVEAELFFLKRVALVASLKMPLTFGSAHQAFNLTGNVGLRFNL